MLIESYLKNGWQILNIKDPMTVSTDPSEIKTLVKNYAARGTKNIAVRFTQDSYLYTKTISVLVQCLEILRENGGKMAIIKPNEDIQDLLATLDFHNVIKIFTSEEEIAAP